MRSNKGIIAMTVLLSLLITGPISASGEGEAAEQDVTVTIWHYFEEGTNVIRESIRMWNEEHGDRFEVDHRFIPFGELKREISQAILVGDVPDIFMIDNPDHASFAAEGQLADITEQVEEWGQTDVFFDGPLNSVMYEDRYYGLPHNSNTVALYYNQDMFDEAGYDRPPETWDELREYSETLTDDEGTYGISFSAIGTEEGTFQLLPFLQQAGADVDSLDSEGAIEALEFLGNLVLDGYASPEVVNQNQQEAAGQFAAENAAMAIGGPWSLDLIREEADFDWDIALLPVKEEGGPQASALGGENFAIMADSDHIDEAWEFIRWSSSADVVRELFWDYYGGGRIPSRSDVANEEGKWVADDELGVFIEQLEFARPRGPHPNWPQISEPIQRAIQATLTGQSSADEALERAAEETSEYFD